MAKKSAYQIVVDGKVIRTYDETNTGEDCSFATPKEAADEYVKGHPEAKAVPVGGKADEPEEETEPEEEEESEEENQPEEEATEAPKRKRGGKK